MKKPNVEMRVCHLVTATVQPAAIEELLRRALGATANAEVTFVSSHGMLDAAEVRWEAADSVRLVNRLAHPESPARRMAEFRQRLVTLISAVEDAKRFANDYIEGEDVVRTLREATAGAPSVDAVMRPNDPTWRDDYIEELVEWLLGGMTVLGGP